MKRFLFDTAAAVVPVSAILAVLLHVLGVLSL
jgi:hypothetical protein